MLRWLDMPLTSTIWNISFFEQFWVFFWIDYQKIVPADTLVYQMVPTWSLTVRPWKATGTQRKGSSSKHPFSGENSLLNFGGDVLQSRETVFFFQFWVKRFSKLPPIWRKRYIFHWGSPNLCLFEDFFFKMKFLGPLSSESFAGKGL